LNLGGTGLTGEMPEAVCALIGNGVLETGVGVGRGANRLDENNFNNINTKNGVCKSIESLLVFTDDRAC
jgi:hypothetical protein